MLDMAPFTAFRVTPRVSRASHLLRISALIRRIIARRLSLGRAPVIASMRSPSCIAMAWSIPGVASVTVTPSLPSAEVPPRRGQQLGDVGRGALDGLDDLPVRELLGHHHQRTLALIGGLYLHPQHRQTVDVRDAPAGLVLRAVPGHRPPHPFELPALVGAPLFQRAQLEHGRRVEHGELRGADRVLAGLLQRPPGRGRPRGRLEAHRRRLGRTIDGEPGPAACPPRLGRPRAVGRQPGARRWSRAPQPTPSGRDR